MDNKELLNDIKNIRDKYKSELVTEEEETSSFLDDINALIRKIFHDEPLDVYTALQPDKLEQWKNSKWKRLARQWFRHIFSYASFYILMMVAVTSFLVSEAVSFYYISGVSIYKAYIKAILTETSFLFIGAYRVSGKLQAIFVNILRVSLFALMLFVITSDVLKRGTEQVSEISRIEQKIVLLEEQIKEKDTAIEFYRKKGWGVNMRKQLDEKDKLLKDLLRLKQEQINGKSAEISDQVQYQTWGRAAFRLILIFINLLLARRLFKF